MKTQVKIQWVIVLFLLAQSLYYLYHRPDYTLNLEKDGKMYLIDKQGDSIYNQTVDFKNPTAFEEALIKDNE